MSELGKQFEQLSLVPEGDPSMTPAGQRQPHQMDPTEFINHQDTVFHASYAPLPKVGRGYNSHHPGIHAGTLDSAEERVARGLGANWDRSGNPAPVHALHVPPERFVNNTGRLWTDAKANDPNSLIHSTDDPTAAYYSNEVEDKGSASVVLNNRHALLTHSDYVRDAIANGKEHEVHPLTLAMYHQGSLDKVEPIDYQKVRITKQPDYNPEAEKLKQHNGGLFPYKHVEGYFDHMLAGANGARKSVAVSREELNELIGGDKASLDSMYKNNGDGIVNARMVAGAPNLDPEVKKRLNNTVTEHKVGKAPAPKRRELGDVTRNRPRPAKKAAPSLPKKAAPPAP